MLGLKLEETQVYQEAKAEGRQEGQREGWQEGRQEGERSLILRQLTHRFGELPESVRSLVDRLTLTQLDGLGEALLDFASLADLEIWLTSVQ